MQNANPSKAVLGGFIATLAMTMMMYAAPMMGMPKMDLAGMLASMFSGGQPPQAMSGMWWMGMLIHFINGSVVFALIYAYVLYGWLAGSPWLRGLTLGLILWFLAQVMVMPMMGAGVFSANTPAPMMMVVGSLMGHMIYGAILGAIAGEQAVRHEYTRQERHV
jgi:Thiol:disulfide interchange protein